MLAFRKILIDDGVLNDPSNLLHYYLNSLRAIFVMEEFGPIIGFNSAQ